MCGQLHLLVPRLLLMLALADTLHLLSSALTFSVANLWSEYAARAWYYVVPVSLPLAQTTMTASVYLTVSLTVERYVSVVKPFFHLKNKLGAASVISSCVSHGLARCRFLRSSVILALPGLLFSVLFTLPNYFMLTTNHHNDPVLESLNVNETELQV